MGESNLKVYFKEDLHDYPEDYDQMAEYVKAEFSVLENLSGVDKFKKISHLAVYSRVLGNYGQAHELFQIASDYFEKSDSKLNLVNLIRWSDVFRFEKKFDEGFKTLQKAEKILNKNNFSDYQDFYLQHLGKIYFDREEYEKAFALFEKVLKLRMIKKNSELISSTEYALKVTKQKLGRVP